MQCRPVCGQTQHPTATLFQLQTRFQSRSDRRTSTGLETLKTLCLSTIYSDWEIPEQDKVRSSGESNSGNSSGANTDLVSDHSGVECGRTVSPSKVPNSANQPQRATPSPLGDPTVGCLGSFRKRLGEAVPEEVGKGQKKLTQRY